jgi:hypothetical protein
MRTALFWVITQRVVVIPYRRFGTNTTRCAITQKRAVLISLASLYLMTPCSSMVFSNFLVETWIWRPHSFMPLRTQLHNPRKRTWMINSRFIKHKVVKQGRFVFIYYQRIFIRQPQYLCDPTHKPPVGHGANEHRTVATWMWHLM